MALPPPALTLSLQQAPQEAIISMQMLANRNITSPQPAFPWGNQAAPSVWVCRK